MPFFREMSSIRPLLPEKTNKEKFREVFPRSVFDLIPVDKNGRANPRSKNKIAMDAAPQIKDLGVFSIPDDIMSVFKQPFIGWQACAYLRQNVYIDRACRIPAEDAIAMGYELSATPPSKEGNTAEDMEIDDDFLDEFRNESFEKYRIGEVCAGAEILNRTFGGALVVPCVSGADMSKPFNIDGIKPGTYEGMRTIEPYWTMPLLTGESISNPASMYFYEPEFYGIAGGGKIHKSWVVKLEFAPVPDLMKPVYYYFGIPLVQMIYERCFAAIRVANEAPLLAQTKRLLVADADLGNYVFNQEEADNAMRNLVYFRDNFGVYIKSPDNGVQQLDTSLSDFDSLIMTQFQLLAAEAGMPVNKLLKTQSKGLGDTGKAEADDYKQTLKSIQEKDYRRIINFHNRLLSKSKYGKELSLKVRFNPYDMPSELEIAELSEKMSIALLHYVSGNILSPEEARNILRNDPSGRFSNISVEPPIELGEYSDLTNPDLNGEKDLSGRYVPNGGRDVL